MNTEDLQRLIDEGAPKKPETTNVLSETFQPETGATFPDIMAPHETQAGWFATAAHEAGVMNITKQALSYITSPLTAKNPQADVIPDGWKPLTLEAVQDYPREYWASIGTATSPADQLVRQQAAKDEIASDAYYAHGSTSAKLAGGIFGAVTDPVSWALPYAAGVKYSGFFNTIARNLSKNLGALAIDSTTRNALIQANREGGNPNNVIVDSARDFVYSAALMGGGIAIGRGLAHAGLWEQRRVMNITEKGFKLDPKVEGGIIVGYTVNPLEAVNSMGGIIGKEFEFRMQAGAEEMAAKETERFKLQEYVDSSFSKTGLFTPLPFIGEPLAKLLAWGPITTPAMKAAVSPYSTVKRYFNGLASASVITEGEAAGRVRADSAEDISMWVSSMGSSASVAMRNEYLEANAITGRSTTANEITNLKNKIQNNLMISEEDFGKEVQSIMLVEGYKSEWKNAHNAATIAMDTLTQIGQMYRDVHGMDGPWGNPRNAYKYLPIANNVEAMIARPEEWQQLTANALKDQDMLIANHTKWIDAGIKEHKQLTALLKEAKKNNPKDPFIKRIERELVQSAEKHNQKIEALEAQIKEDSSLAILIDRDLHEAHLEKLAKKEKELLEKNEALEAAGKKPLVIKKNKFALKTAPFFRAAYGTDAERALQASQWYDAKMNMSPQDILSNVFGGVNSLVNGKSVHVKSRSMLIDQQIYNEAGFLERDTGKVITSYAQSMGKSIGLQAAFPEFASGKVLSGIAETFQKEHKELVDKTLLIKDTAKRKKALKKLQKQFTDNQKFMSDAHKVYMGTYSSNASPAVKQALGILNNMAVASKLGAVPIYQISDLAGITIKQGIMPGLAESLGPMLRSIGATTGSKEARYIRESAADMHLATNHVAGAYALHMNHSGSMSEAPVGGRLAQAHEVTKNIANLSGNLFGTNYIDNQLQMMAATGWQSAVMRAAYQVADKTITQATVKKMARYGIDIYKESESFIKNYTEAQGWEQSGAYFSNSFLWKDLAASQRMSLSVRRMVNDTIIRKGMFTSPMWMNDPVWSTVFMFHGWGYSAFAKFVIPAMQRPNAEHAMGIVSMIGLNMLSDPLLRMANGKSMYEDNETWFQSSFKALENSGVIGPGFKFLEQVNAAAGNPILPTIQTEKTKQRPQLGGLGPSMGMIQSLVGGIGHGIKGDMTQADAKKLIYLFPYLNALPLRYVGNKWLEQSSLPKTRRGLHGKSLYDRITE